VTMVKGHISTPEDSLCASCKQLDVAHLFAGYGNDEPVPAQGRHVISLHKRSQKITCQMCQFFINLAPSYKRDYKQHVRLFDRIKASTLKPFDAIQTRLPRSRFLSILRENTRLVYDNNIQDEIVQSGVVVMHESGNTANSSPVRTINPSRVDYEFIAACLDTCEKTHDICKQIPHEFNLPFIQLIDCHERKVVTRPSRERYFALSYVWGPTQQERTLLREELLEDKEFSFNKSPLTVQDAILATQRLGRRYIWIDKYCIAQHGIDKQKTLLNMDQIYKNAEATLVSLYGTNDQSGLPGVSSTARTEQPRFPVGDACLISSCPPISTVIQSSTWATRGWCYQEARLSQRCLFFTEYQVYLVCQEGTRSEAVPEEASTSYIPYLINSSCLDANIFGPAVSIADGIYRDRLAFTRRSLTRESDILDAFRGILHASDFVSLYGIPIAPVNSKMDPYTAFALGLLWTRTPAHAMPRHLRSYKEPRRVRRKDFPTWSWTSVTGEIYNQTHGEGSAFGRYLKGDVEATIESHAYLRIWLHIDDKPVPLHEIMATHNSNILPEDSSDLLVEADVVQVFFQEDVHNRYKPACLDGGNFVLTPFYAVFDLDPDPVRGHKRKISDDRPLVIEHGPFDTHGIRRGLEDAIILVNWNDDQRQSKHRCILMLIEWTGEGRARRRGLLSEYKLSHEAAHIKELPKRRCKFILE
jgi:hypothetical protein